MSDRELLEAAASAYWGDEIDDTCSIRWLEEEQAIGYTQGDNQDHNGDDRELVWNPLHDDGDAMRLAVKLGLDFYEGDDDGRAAYVGYYDRSGNTRPQRFAIERHDAHADPYAATRRAIVRAAAAMAGSAAREGE